MRRAAILTAIAVGSIAVVLWQRQAVHDFFDLLSWFAGEGRA